MASVSSVSNTTATNAATYTNTTSSSLDTNTQLEQLKAEKNKDEQELLLLQKDTKNANSLQVKNLKKEIENLEKEIQQLESSSSTANTSSTTKTASTAATSTAEQDKALLKKFGPAYETKISTAGYEAQQTDEKEQQNKTNQLS